MDEAPLAAPTPDRVVTPDKVVERPSPLTGLARSGIALAAAAVFFARDFAESPGSFSRGPLIAGVVAAAIALIGGVSGIITWRTTTFVADDDEFRIERNFISKSSTRVDYTKVQSIDISQPLIARLLGLAKVHIDVGGAGGVGLSFLTKARAETLREHLLRRMQAAKVGPVEASGELTAVEEPAEPEAEELVVAVPPRNLMLGTLVSIGALLSLLLAAVFVLVSIFATAPVTLVAGVIAVVGWVWSQTGKNWGFRMTRQGDTLRIRRGLLSTVTQGLRPKRVQAVAIRQDLLQRLTGLYQVSVTVLGYGDPTSDDDASTNAIVLPYGTWDEVMAVLHAIWPGVDLNTIEPHQQPARARWLTPFTFRTHTWGIGEDVVVAQHELLTQIRSIVPHRRMQSASIEQGPLQRRLRLASISVHTTDGPVSLRLYHLDADLARRVFEDQLARARQARAAVEG